MSCKEQDTPAKEANMNTMTPAQCDLIKRLQEERDLSLSPDALGALANLRNLWRDGLATTRAASRTISLLLDAPNLPHPIERDPEAGVYVSEETGEYLRAYLGQASGRMLAKQIHIEPGEVSYTYLGAARRYLTPDYRRCTLEEAGSLGKASGICIHCGRRLDDPESVDRGIGPICADKY